MSEETKNLSPGISFSQSIQPYLEKIENSSSQREREILFEALQQIRRNPLIGLPFSLENMNLLRYFAPPFMIVYELIDNPHPLPIIYWIEVNKHGGAFLKHKISFYGKWIIGIGTFLAFLSQLTPLIEFLKDLLEGK